MVQIYRPPGWEQHDAHSPGWQKLWLFLLLINNNNKKISFVLCHFPSRKFSGIVSNIFLLAIANFRNLHGKFQAFTSLMAGLKKAAINVTVTVAVVVGVVFIGSLVVSIGWTTGICQPMFTGIRQHYKKVPKLAEQAGQDKCCAFI